MSQYHDENDDHTATVWLQLLLPSKWHICYPPIQIRVRNGVFPRDSTIITE
jgi:hypothetical protein